MYDKRKINILFKTYADTREDEILGRLIEECEPIIDIVLIKYTKYSRHRDDMKQEVLLRLWRNLRLRDAENLARYLINPCHYLFFLIRTYCLRGFFRMFSVHKEEYESSLESIMSEQAEQQEMSYDG